MRAERVRRTVTAQVAGGIRRAQRAAAELRKLWWVPASEELTVRMTTHVGKAEREWQQVGWDAWRTLADNTKRGVARAEWMLAKARCTEWQGDKECEVGDLPDAPRHAGSLAWALIVHQRSQLRKHADALQRASDAQERHSAVAQLSAKQRETVYKLAGESGIQDAKVAAGVAARERITECTGDNEDEDEMEKESDAKQRKRPMQHASAVRTEELQRPNKAPRGRQEHGQDTWLQGSAEHTGGRHGEAEEQQQRNAVARASARRGNTSAADAREQEHEADELEEERENGERESERQLTSGRRRRRTGGAYRRTGRRKRHEADKSAQALEKYTTETRQRGDTKKNEEKEPSAVHNKDRREGGDTGETSTGEHDNSQACEAVRRTAADRAETTQTTDRTGYGGGSMETEQTAQ